MWSGSQFEPLMGKSKRTKNRNYETFHHKVTQTHTHRSIFLPQAGSFWYEELIKMMFSLRGALRFCFYSLICFLPCLLLPFTAHPPFKIYFAIKHHKHHHKTVRFFAYGVLFYSSMGSLEDPNPLFFCRLAV